MFKKLLAICMVMLLALSTPFSAVAHAEEVTQSEDTELSGKINSKPIYIYSWNTEIETVMESFYDKYPQYKKLVKIVNLGKSGVSEEYISAINKKIKKGGAKVPSIVVYDNDIVQQQICSSDYVTLSSIGFKSKDYKNAYNYTKQVGSVNGKLKAVTWQVMPGCFIYNTKIAKEVFGTDDPAKIQNKIKDWDSFLKAAKKLKKKGYYMLNGTDDLRLALSVDNYTSYSVKNKKIQTGSKLKADIKYLKKLVDNKYVAQNPMWDTAWYDNMDIKKGKVFGYFGAPWFAYWSMTASEGTFNMCAGPANYHWGGSYLTVTKKCPNPDLAALVLKTICSDTTVMTSRAEEAMDFPNNKSAVKKLIANNAMNVQILKKQNALTVWDSVAKKVSYKKLTKYDFGLMTDFYVAVYLCRDKGTFTENAIIKKYKEYAKKRYSELK